MTAHVTSLLIHQTRAARRLSRSKHPAPHSASLTTLYICTLALHQVVLHVHMANSCPLRWNSSIKTRAVAVALVCGVCLERTATTTQPGPQPPPLTVPSSCTQKSTFPRCSCLGSQRSCPCSSLPSCSLRWSGTIPPTSWKSNFSGAPPLKLPT